MCFYGVLGRQHSHDKNMSYDRPAPKTHAVPSVYTHSCGQLWLSRLSLRTQHRHCGFGFSYTEFRWVLRDLSALVYGPEDVTEAMRKLLKSHILLYVEAKQTACACIESRRSLS